jgi:hypothetical protein
MNPNQVFPPSPPASAGSFPISTYQAVAPPGGQSCLVSVPTVSGTITGLTNGTAYTATVRALSGAGWGPDSSASDPVTPEAPEVASLVITGSRGEVRGRPGVIVTGGGGGGYGGGAGGTKSGSNGAGGGGGGLMGVGSETSISTAPYGRICSDRFGSNGYVIITPGATSSSMSPTQNLPSDVIQQVGIPESMTCADFRDDSLNWAGISSGGWTQSWAQWVNDGNGRAVCTRTLVYTANRQWSVA